MGGGARALVRQPKTAVFLQKSLKPSGSKSVNLFLQSVDDSNNVVFQQLFQCQHSLLTFILAAQGRRCVRIHATSFLVQINCNMIFLCASFL